MRVKAFCIVAACLATLSCQKIAAPEMTATGPLGFEPTRFVDGIPEDYGVLVGVTANAVNPDWATLWFQRSDKTIVAVSVNVIERTLTGGALMIPRK